MAPPSRRHPRRPRQPHVTALGSSVGRSRSRSPALRPCCLRPHFPSAAMRPPATTWPWGQKADSCGAAKPERAQQRSPQTLARPLRPLCHLPWPSLCLRQAPLQPGAQIPRRSLQAPWPPLSLRRRVPAWPFHPCRQPALWPRSAAHCQSPDQTPLQGQSPQLLSSFGSLFLPHHQSLTLHGHLQPLRMTGLLGPRTHLSLALHRGVCLER